MGQIEKLNQRLRLRVDGFNVTVSSTDVAAYFNREHRLVLRDIEELLAAVPDLDEGWFSICLHERGNTEWSARSYEMTHESFLVLVDPWNTEHDLACKRDYAHGFDAMNEFIRSRARSLPPHDLASWVNRYSR